MRHPTSFRGLDISSCANRGFADAAGRGQAGGWTGQGENDLRGLKPGDLKAGRMAFAILDPAANRNRSVVALRNADRAFATRAEIGLGCAVCDWVYLLHATSWIESGTGVGTLTLAYVGGQEVEIPIAAGAQVADWWSDEDLDGVLRLQVHGANPVRETASLYACAIRNPQPGRKLARIAFAIGGDLGSKATWMIPAVATGTGRCMLTGPTRVAIVADPGRSRGSIRRLHGANIGAPIFLNQLRDRANELLRELEIPVTRMHDCPWDNAGLKLIDVHQVFPLFHADHTDPANYFFKQTDDFIANCLANGSAIYYRLGASIEHMAKSYFAIPPADYAKWSEICVNIIRHYNAGWADGFHHGIEYWEIWNEPNLGRQMWTGTWDDYLRLYVTAAKRIKAEFPALKVGGPGLTAVIPELIEGMLAECRKHDAPLDFFSWHKYGSNVESIVRQPAIVKRLLEKHGYRHAELHLNEWHYASGPWVFSGAAAARNHAEWNGADGAAYLCAVLSGWQDTPLDMGHYYTSSIMPWWGMFDVFGQPNKCYYGMKCFAAMTRHPRRFAVEVAAGEKVWALGGSDGDGNSAIMVSCCKEPAKRITLRLAGARLDPAKIRVRCLDASRDLAATDDFSVSANAIRLSKPRGSIVYLIEFSA